jgi:hypothetical protein
MAVLDRQGVPKDLLMEENERKTDFMTAIGTLQAFSLISAVKVSHSHAPAPSFNFLTMKHARSPSINTTTHIEESEEYVRNSSFGATSNDIVAQVTQ